MKLFLLFHIFIISLFALGKGTVVSSKIIDGVHISLVKTEAEVLPNRIRVNNTNEYRDDGTKSLFFYKLDGTTGLSKQRFKVVPNARGERVNIYYVEKDNEKYEHEYTVFFNKEDILFDVSKPIQRSNSNQPEMIEKGKVKHLIRDIFESSGTYITLFLFFLALNGFFNNDIIYTMLNKKIIYALQMLIILIFLFGGEHIIRTEHNSCYQTPYVTEGKIDYFLGEPYVRFIDCYGHKSKSKRKNPELLGKAKNDSVQIYYNHATRDYYSNEDTNIYRVYTSESEYNKKSEIPMRVYFGLLMLFIFLYSYVAKEKRLYLPTFLSNNKNKIYSYKQERKSFSELLKIVDKKYYEIGTLEEYFVDPIVFTNSSNQVVIERFKLFDVLLPGAVAFGLLWVVFKAFTGMDDINAPTPSGDDKIIIGVIGLFGLMFLYITVKNYIAKKRVGVFDRYSRTYMAYSEDKLISFDEINAYTITYKNVWDNDREYRMDLFELDMVLTNGNVVNLYARKGNNNLLYEEAKIISSYTNKPIYDFEKKDINKVFRIAEYLIKVDDSEE